MDVDKSGTPAGSEAAKQPVFSTKVRQDRLRISYPRSAGDTIPALFKLAFCIFLCTLSCVCLIKPIKGAEYQSDFARVGLAPIRIPKQQQQQ